MTRKYRNPYGATCELKAEWDRIVCKATFGGKVSTAVVGSMAEARRFMRRFGGNWAEVER